MNLVAKRKTFYVISLAVIAVGVIALATRGLNLGIDFTSGTLFQVRLAREAKAQEVRDVLNRPALAGLGLAKSVVQPVGKSDVQVRTVELSASQVDKVVAELKTAFGGAELMRNETVGPVIGRELLNKALLALLLSWAGIIIYVSYRFEFKFAVPAVIALVHDVLITTGIFALMGREVNTPFVAALLTIIGYSINDTIVVYDKIRENLKGRKRESLDDLVNKSILQTLTRSINTVITTQLAVVAVYLLGGETIKDFSLALVIGLTVGTYSSVFVASPLWLDWKKWERAREKKLAVAKAKA